MKKILFVSMLYLAWISGAMSQTITPNTTERAVCPNTATIYTVTPPQGKTVNSVRTYGSSISLTRDNSDANKFTIIWDDVIDSKSIRVYYDAALTDYTDFPTQVLSVKNTIPGISSRTIGYADCPRLIVGKTHFFELTAQLLYSYLARGTSDPTEVKGYEWQIFSGGTGWRLNQTNENGIMNKIGSFTTDAASGAVIRVRGISKCNLYSEWQYCTIERYVPQPCPITGAPAYVICQDTRRINLSAAEPSGVNGYTYEWTFPPQWTGSASTDRSTDVRPNGTSGGTISVVAKYGSLRSVPCTVNIALEPIDPNTEVLGLPVLCNNENKAMSYPLHCLLTQP